MADVDDMLLIGKIGRHTVQGHRQRNDLVRAQWPDLRFGCQVGRLTGYVSLVVLIEDEHPDHDSSTDQERDAYENDQDYVSDFVLEQVSSLRI